MTVDEMTPVQDELRDRAVRRLHKKHDFHAHLLVYVLFNAGITMVWVLAGANGIFWPAFLMAFWGIGVVMNAWDVYGRDDFGEPEIRREMDRLSRR